ncbi:MAG: Flp family type IVb pilin [Chloroflexi bacterium]|nr:Flp family type IVb pilin [Chloroflexota bacterium]
MHLIRRFWLEETGADATEYALLAALIAVAIIGGATTLGDAIGDLFTGIGGTVDGAGYANDPTG